MTEENAREDSGEIEIYGELGLLPKAGVKIRLARQTRLNRVIDSATEHAGLDRTQLEDRVADSDDRVRDIVAAAALRAAEVDDAEYIDALGRLIAGALDAAAVDELAFVTSEITKLEPVHLRALLGFFWFGREGDVAADPDLSPADAAWAASRHRTDRDIASLLLMTHESAAQVLLRLDRDGLIHLHGGPARDGETTSTPRDWAGRVVSTLFPRMEVKFRNTPDGSGDENDIVPVASANAVAVSPGANPEIRAQRAVTELEAEIKKLERQRHGAARLDLIAGEPQWLATLKRRLRRVDPDNPWAYDD